MGLAEQRDASGACRRSLTDVWWSIVVVALLVAAGVCGFVVLTKTMTRGLSSPTNRTAEDLYDSYADPRATRRDERS